ncbi:MAG TPA: hypothetical protein ENJ20_03400 [Bacteroidetes bacterium]|nr:hypothetical protein [Bacteroidota bacterium]
MSKLIPSVFGAACFVWVSIWSWWLQHEHTSRKGSDFALPGIRITDPDTVFIFKNIFTFHLSDHKPVLLPQSDTLLKELAGYLNRHPDKILTLTGAYLPMPYERNHSPHPNLGIGRAIAIKNLLAGQGADPDRIKTAAQEVNDHLMLEDRLLGGVDFDFTKKTALPDEKEGANTEKKTVSPSKSPTDSGKQPPVSSLVFHYDKNDFAVERKYRPALDKLRRLVRKHPSYRLIITGYSTKEEEKKWKGLARRRSLAVRRYLVDSGVRRRNIIVESRPGAAINENGQKVEITVVK